MPLPIVTADQRLEARGIKGQIWGKAGVGKTSQLWTLPPETTLAVDMEAGMLAVEGWKGDSITVRSWDEARDLACFIGGPNPALRTEQPYSEAHYNHIVEKFGDRNALAKYQTFFVDSTTVAGRLCMQWAQGQPDAFSDKTGKPDMRGAYGLLGREMIAWANQLHHTPIKNIWLVGGLDQREDDIGRKLWVPLIDGSKAANEFPYILDEVITMAVVTAEDGTPFRAFVCQALNQWGFPAKDRSGRLDVMEEPHLGKLMNKILTGELKPAEERLEFGRPAAPSAATPEPTTSEEHTQPAEAVAA